jgi:uncharacterized sulfatase
MRPFELKKRVNQFQKFTRFFCAVKRTAYIIYKLNYMRKKDILPVILSGVTLSVTAQQEAGKTNIVVIVADDLGTNELGCYGGTNLPTPHIDRLAGEGIRLTNNFASCAMSVPIRASLYTGLYPARHGSYQNHKASYGNLKSVTHYLSGLGYRVGRTGKDHPVGQQAVYNFEKIDGFTVDCVASHPSLATTDGVRTFIERNDEQPFCLFVCSIHPHMPWDAGDASRFNPADVTLPPNTVDTQRTREEFCNYLAEIKLLDDEVGAIVNVLEETGKLDNTLVIFLGEQGPQLPFGKWNCYRYSQNSAFIARYPAKIAPNTTGEAIVQYEDILPTMIDFAGGEAVEGLDGESFLDVLWGESEGTREWSYGIHNNIPEGNAYPIRSIQDKRYKLILNLSPENDYGIKYLTVPGNALWTSWLTKAETDNNAKFLTDRFIKRPALELYDLENDKWELNNLAALPEHAKRIAAMKAELERWMQQQGDRGVLMDIDDPEDPNLKTPLAIGSIDDINSFMRNDLSGNYYLVSDIEIPEGTEWIPVGAASATDTDPQRFKGIFDGKGHGIKNLKISTESSFKGFFGRIDHAEIRNLDLIDVNIKGKAPLGAVSGAMIGNSKIERVSVSGHLEGDTEVGGIVGRIARDPTHTGYNIIHDCYVTAAIKATGLSTNMNAPSCAGGIAAFMHSNTGTSVAKADIRRVYVAGSITSEQKNNTAGNAAGILAFYDNNTNIVMEEVIVLCDTIGAATSNLFFSRRGGGYADFVLFDKVYARSGITLNYLNPADKGRGGEIPEGIISYFPAETYKTLQFYVANLSWDFENVWYMNEGEYPALRKEQATFIKPEKQALKYKILSVKNGIDVLCSGSFSVNIYDLAGKKIHGERASGQTFIPLSKGMYVVSLAGSGKRYSDKVIVI